MITPPNYFITNNKLSEELYYCNYKEIIASDRDDLLDSFVNKTFPTISLNNYLEIKNTIEKIGELSVVLDKEKCFEWYYNYQPFYESGLMLNKKHLSLIVHERYEMIQYFIENCNYNREYIIMLIREKAIRYKKINVLMWIHKNYPEEFLFMDNMGSPMHDFLETNDEIREYLKKNNPSYNHCWKKNDF